MTQHALISIREGIHRVTKVSLHIFIHTYDSQIDTFDADPECQIDSVTHRVFLIHEFFFMDLNVKMTSGLI